MSDDATPQNQATLELSAFIAKTLSDAGLVFSVSPNQEVISLAFKGKRFEIAVTLYCGDTYLTVHAALPLIVRSEETLALLNFLNEKNSMAPVGGFEVSVISSKILYKVGFMVPPLPQSSQVLSAITLAADATADIAAEALALMS